MTEAVELLRFAGLVIVVGVLAYGFAWLVAEALDWLFDVEDRL